MEKPLMLYDDGFRSLRCGDIDQFHQYIASCEIVDYSNSNLRGTDMRKADLSKVDLTGAYLRDADLRGLDLRQHNLEGCMLLNARISGVYFPKNISPQEIALSHELGTRLRTSGAP